MSDYETAIAKTIGTLLDKLNKLEQENAALKAENERLRELVRNKLTEDAQKNGEYD